MSLKDVHTEHCCIIHGCKYYKDDECSVIQRKAKQSFPCELCTPKQFEIINETWKRNISINKYIENKIKEIKDAYVWIRKNNSSIPDDVLDLMKDSAIKTILGSYNYFEPGEQNES